MVSHTDYWFCILQSASLSIDEDNTIKHTVFYISDVDYIPAVFAGGGAGGRGGAGLLLLLLVGEPHLLPPLHRHPLLVPRARQHLAAGQLLLALPTGLDSEGPADGAREGGPPGPPGGRAGHRPAGARQVFRGLGQSRLNQCRYGRG